MNAYLPPRGWFFSLVLAAVLRVGAADSPEELDTGNRWLPFELSFGGAGTDVGEDVAVDGDGNIVVAGWTESKVWSVGEKQIAAEGDGVLIKLSDDGRNLWAMSLDSPCYHLAVDGGRNILVLGGAGARGHLSSSQCSITKIDGNSNPLWSRKFGAARGNRVLADARGDVFIAGSCNRTLTFSPSGGGAESSKERDPKKVESVGGVSRTRLGGTDSDAFVCKVSGDGALMWVVYLGGLADEEAEDLALDGKGNLLVVGWTYSPGWVRGAVKNVLSEGTANGFLVKLGNDGSHLWSTFLGLNYRESQGAFDVRVVPDGDGSILVIGASANSERFFVDKFSADGKRLWCDYGFGAARKGANEHLRAGFDQNGKVLLMNFDVAPHERWGGFLFACLDIGSGKARNVLHLPKEVITSNFAVCQNGDVVVTGETYSPTFARREGMGSKRHDGFVVRLGKSRFSE